MIELLMLHKWIWYGIYTIYLFVGSVIFPCVNLFSANKTGLSEFGFLFTEPFLILRICQALVGTISLRRTKAAENGSKGLVGLPSKTIESCFVELSAEEREQYDRLESEAQNTIREYIDADTVLHNYSTVLHIILRLRQICNDVALCPSDIKSFLPSNALEGKAMFTLILSLQWAPDLLPFGILPNHVLLMKFFSFI